MLQNIKKLKGTLSGSFFEKKSHNAEKRKTEKGDPLGFFNILSVAKQQKIEGGPFDEKISKKLSHYRKKIKVEPFSLARYRMLRGKRGKSFLAQIVRRNGSI